MYFNPNLACGAPAGQRLFSFGYGFRRTGGHHGWRTDRRRISMRCSSHETRGDSQVPLPPVSRARRRCLTKATIPVAGALDRGRVAAARQRRARKSGFGAFHLAAIRLGESAADCASKRGTIPNGCRACAATVRASLAFFTRISRHVQCSPPLGHADVMPRG